MALCYQSLEVGNRPQNWQNDLVVCTRLCWNTLQHRGLLSSIPLCKQAYLNLQFPDFDNPHLFVYWVEKSSTFFFLCLISSTRRLTSCTLKIRKVDSIIKQFPSFTTLTIFKIHQSSFSLHRPVFRVQRPLQMAVILSACVHEDNWSLPSAAKQKKQRYPPWLSGDTYTHTGKRKIHTHILVEPWGAYIMGG